MRGGTANKKNDNFILCARGNGFEIRPSITQERQEDIDFVVWPTDNPSRAFAVAVKNTLLKKTKKRTHLWGWVELRDRYGNDGWIYKKCTFVIYERKMDFALIFKKDLLKWINRDNIARWDLPFVDTGWRASYRLYRRPQTQEAIFQVKVSDALKQCRHEIWPKHERVP